MSERKIGQLSFADKMVADATGGNETLERIAAMVDWAVVGELVSPIRAGVMGAPGYPSVMLFKALLLQRWYNLSDPGLEEALRDRLSFRSFVGLPLHEAIPDHSTIWRFREAMGRDVSDRVFAEIGRQIEGSGFVMKEGTLIDASLIPAAVNPPKRPEGPMPEDETGRAASKLIPSELDPDAAWAKKEGEYHFGYKLHIGMDKASRIIRRLILTPGNINESQVADALICGDEKAAYADKAYDSHARRRSLKQKGIRNGIMRRGHPRRPLTPADIRRNKRISKLRAPIEPLFSLIKNVYGFTRARYRGLKRNACAFQLAATAMNLKRWASHQTCPA
jgi:IS5 family transposase